MMEPKTIYGAMNCAAEDKTPIHSSGTYPIYRNAAEEMIRKLNNLNDPTALMMSADLQWFAETFVRWSPQNRPDDVTRERIIREFMDLHRKCRSFYEEVSLV